MNVQLSAGTEGLARAAALEAIADRLSRFLRVLDAENWHRLLDQLGDDQANGWTKATLLELVKRRVGLGAFSRERRVPFFFCFFSADEEAHI